jgi:hypothetical protein
MQNNKIMKKYIFPIILGGAVMFSSCGDDTAENTDPAGGGDSTVVESSEVNLKGLREFDMSEYDLNVIIYIPEKYYMDQELQVEKFVQPTIVHNDGEALWDITMPGDKHFHMVLEDWGDIKQTVADEKNIHNDQAGIYDFSYESEGEDYMLFVRKLKSENTTNETDLSQLPMHHFYAVKQIDGYYITAKSFSMQDFHKVSANTMLNCARGMKSSK